MKIKICGLKDSENIKAVAAILPDYMGFICYDRSSRYIENMPFDALNNLPSFIRKTAVFVNESENRINLFIDNFGFNAIQLHGNESPDFCSSFKSRVKVIKAFGLDLDFDFSKLLAYEGKVDFFLFDTKTDLHGGSGKSFDWDLLNRYNMDIPFFLSGGLGLENLEAIKNIHHPQFYGLDLNSRFEISAGIKSVEDLKSAFEIVNKTLENEIRS